MPPANLADNQEESNDFSRSLRFSRSRIALMVKGWGSATLCLHVLLIALVIPELTPDMREL